MKFYDCATAPSPRRVRIFLAEKGITVPLVPINLRAGEQLGAAFRAINPDCTVPVLELDNGVRIADADKDESEVVANAARATAPKMKRRPGVRHRRSRIGLEDRL